MPENKNPLSDGVKGRNDSAKVAFAWTPSDSLSIPDGSRAVYVGTTGDLTVEMYDGGQAVFHNVPAGALLPIAVRKILAATTASDIVVLL